MEITTRNLIDIERYTNDLRENTLRLLFGEGEDIIDANGSYAAVAHAFDRATTTALFKHITAGGAPQPPAESLHGSLKSPVSGRGTGKGGPKPGSAAARARAQKAQETRRKNKAAKAAKAAGAGDGNTSGISPNASAGNAVTRPAPGVGQLGGGV